MTTTRVVAVAVAVLGLLPLRVFGSEESSVDPNKDLQKDIQILGHIIGAPSDFFAQFTPPVVHILSKEEFTAKRVQEAKDINSEFTENYEQLGAYTYPECGDEKPTLIEISAIYAETAEAFNPPMPAWDYFRIVRIHELYHWAVCKLAGEDRFFVPDGERSWNREEAYARSIEHRFSREQLGSKAALSADYLVAPHPREMPEGSLPDPILRQLPWQYSEAGDDHGLVKWDTKTGDTLMLRILVSTVTYTMDTPPNPHFKDFEAQHLPGYKAAADTGAGLYYYNAIMHRGKYVGIEQFMLTRENAKNAMSSNAYTRVVAWWDAGYVPTGKDGLGPAPDDPIYQGRWVKVFQNKN